LKKGQIKAIQRLGRARTKPLIPPEIPKLYIVIGKTIGISKKPIEVRNETIQKTFTAEYPAFTYFNVNPLSFLSILK
jgi:hypothetical protein